MSMGSDHAVTTTEPQALREQLLDGAETALLDVREEGSFCEAHLLYASCMPLSRLELLVARMVPRRTTRVVLCDGGEGLAERAAERLERLGYDGVSVLAGGTPAWQGAGFELFSGVNVPSKAFGELVEHDYGTPSVSADELKASLDRGEDLVILDSRPIEEFRSRSIPGGVCVPGGELVYRVAELAPSPTTRVVVNCAGRTRSIIGAQSLINAGIPNSVCALRNGTMGWHLAGHRLDTGNMSPVPAVSDRAVAHAVEAADRAASRFGVRAIDYDRLHALRAEEDRTLFLLDVRTPDEYLLGHLPGSWCAPGGQLVQETDRYVPVQHARIVLVDDTGARARMAASWLAQMGWDVAVLDDAFSGRTLVRGEERAPLLRATPPWTDTIAPESLRSLVRAGAVAVIDLSLSRSYRQAHVPGAVWTVRARLEAAIRALPPRARLVLTCEDGVLSDLAAPEAAEAFGGQVLVLEGGNGAWCESGFEMAAGMEEVHGPVDDLWLRPYEREGAIEQAMQDYLTWEVGLVEQVARDGTGRFRGRAAYFPGDDP